MELHTISRLKIWCRYVSADAMWRDCLGVVDDIYKLIDIAEAAQEAKNAFMEVDDGFYTGLLPPQFVKVSLALIEAEK